MVRAGRDGDDPNGAAFDRNESTGFVIPAGVTAAAMTIAVRAAMRRWKPGEHG
jgi:hypothetical protein